MCWHKSKLASGFFHRAKPASEKKRSGIELHSGHPLRQCNERSEIKLHSEFVSAPHVNKKG